MKISVLVMSHNSEQTLGRTLKSLEGFDQVLLVDGGSSDKTLEIAKEFSYVTVIQNKFIGFSQQRNFLLSQATHQWCLFVDSDEAVTDELRIELYKTIKSDPSFNLYAIKRTEYLDNHPVETGFGRSSYQDRLMKKDKTIYVGDIHEYPLIDGVRHHHDSKARGHINQQCRLLHNPQNSLKNSLVKIAQYSQIKAVEKIKQGRTTNSTVVILSFIGTLLKVWFISFREGKRGFLISLMEALHRTMVKAIIYEEQMLKEETLPTKDN